MVKLTLLYICVFGTESYCLWCCIFRQVNSYNWGACNNGNAPCDSNQNLNCGRFCVILLNICECRIMFF